MLKVIQDFPAKGIKFLHIAPLIADAKAFRECILDLTKDLPPFDVVAGLDARGFIIATAIQFVCGKPQVMIRKKGKFPGPVYTEAYEMEYGAPKEIELEMDSNLGGKRVLLADDLLATGGTMSAAIRLILAAGGTVVACAFIAELEQLGGAERLRAIVPEMVIRSLFNKDGERKQAPVIVEYRPVKYSGYGKRPILMWHPTMEQYAQDILAESNFRPSYLDWKYFPDGGLNLRFEPSQTLRGHDVVYLFSLEKLETFAEQMVLLTALPRQGIRSLTVIIPYLAPATCERVDFSGMTATVEPICKSLSEIPPTRQGPTTIMIYDVHATVIRFYVKDSVVVRGISAIPLLKDTLPFRQPIAFPDEGAYKRFGYQFEGYPTVICGKRRVGNERIIHVQNRINWPINKEEETKLMHTIVIVDDLAQSGGTLIECAKALLLEGFGTIQAYVTHGVFPNESWKKFAKGDIISKFYITDTVQRPRGELPKVFHVLSTVKHLVKEITTHVRSVQAYNRKVKNIYVASLNADKLEAIHRLWVTSPFHFRIYGVGGLSSGVPEQPLGQAETFIGATNRMTELKKLNLDYSRLYAIESGIRGEYEDFVVTIQHIKHAADEVHISKICVQIPKHMIHYVAEARKEGKTFGSVLEEQLGLPSGTWLKYYMDVKRVDQILSCF